MSEADSEERRVVAQLRASPLRPEIDRPTAWGPFLKILPRLILPLVWEAVNWPREWIRNKRLNNERTARETEKLRLEISEKEIEITERMSSVAEIFSARKVNSSTDSTSTEAELVLQLEKILDRLRREHGVEIVSREVAGEQLLKQLTTESSESQETKEQS